MDPAGRPSLDVIVEVQTSWAGAAGLARVAEVVSAFDSEDQPLAPGEVGEIAVQGPNVTAGYLQAPEATPRPAS